MQRRWAGDVLVIGAGATGLIAAQRFVDAGLSVTIVERGSVGGEQSNHSHGYMHRGHIYLTPSLDLVQNLSRGADRWSAEMNELGIRPASDESSLLFTSAYEADVASAAWNRAGLNFREAEDSPPGVTPDGFVRSFVTRESTFDFTQWLTLRYRRLAAEPSVRIIRANVVRLEREAATLKGAVVTLAGEEVLLASSFVVLCAGTGNLELAATATRFRGNGVNRNAPMLVLRGPDLPNLTAVFHGHETHGLFIASRDTDRGPVWLVSNYVSYAGKTITSTALRLWLRDIRSTLVSRTTGLADPRNEWGYYVAPKGELRNIRTSLNGHAVQSYGLENLVVASPTKLTLAHLLGDVVMEEVDSRLHRYKRPSGALDVEVGPPLPVAAEYWTKSELEPVDSLMGI